LTTLGVTLLVFGAAAGPGFPGPDWKVPFFLFTILVAVGEDYNIFLVTRVREEQRGHGPAAGVTEALARTGGVITSCGLIMAGTFASLFAGSLPEMWQMGFALAFGVLLDTLFAAALLSFSLRDPTDALIILAIVLISALLGFWQEWGAARAVEKLLAVIRPKAAVVRDGKTQDVPVETVVPGDIVVLSAGEN